MKYNTFNAAIIAFVLCIFFTTNTNAVSRNIFGNIVSSEIQIEPGDSVAKYLVASSAEDFFKNTSAEGISFRKVRLGHVKNPEGKNQYLLYGLFRINKKGTNAKWISFVTIKTSGYEQWIGAQALNYYKGSSILWEKSKDLTAQLQKHYDSLK